MKSIVLRRSIVVCAVVAFSVLACCVLTVRPAVATSSGCLFPPVAATIAERFVAPECEWCRGRRGVTFADAAGTTVRAAAAGVVTFSGIVVGTPYLVIETSSGSKLTYGSMYSPLKPGDTVTRGNTVGVSGGGMYFGVREPGGGATGSSGLVYVDPEPLLGRLVGPVRLVPVDGRPGNKPRTLRLAC